MAWIAIPNRGYLLNKEQSSKSEGKEEDSMVRSVQPMHIQIKNDECADGNQVIECSRIHYHSDRLALDIIHSNVVNHGGLLLQMKLMRSKESEIVNGSANVNMREFEDKHSSMDQSYLGMSTVRAK